MANHEYLVYKSDNTDLDGQEASKVYALLCVLPYPLNTNPINAPHLANLTKRQRLLLDENEEIVILEKLREINPKICVLRFPKSMYQLYISSLLDLYLPETIIQTHIKSNKIRKQYYKDLKILRSMVSNLIDTEPFISSLLNQYLSYVVAKDEVLQPHYLRLVKKMIRIMLITGAKAELFIKMLEDKIKPYIDNLQKDNEYYHYKSVLVEKIDYQKRKASIGLVDGFDLIDFIHYSKEFYYMKCNSANTLELKTMLWSAINEALITECKIKDVLLGEYGQEDALLAKNGKFSNSKQYAKILNNLAIEWSKLHKDLVLKKINKDEKLALVNNDRDDCHETTPQTFLRLLQYQRDRVNEHIPKLLQKILQFEIECMTDIEKSKLYIIYRGSHFGPLDGFYQASEEANKYGSLYEDGFFIKECKDFLYGSEFIQIHKAADNHSGLSYGDGLFAGNINDTSAVAWNYMSGAGCFYGVGSEFTSRLLTCNTGYALLLTRNQANELFTIPPLTNLVKTFGQGELFHPRSTKLYNSYESYPEIKYHIFSDRRKERLQNYLPNTNRLLREHKLSREYDVVDMYNGPNRYVITLRKSTPRVKFCC